MKECWIESDDEVIGKKVLHHFFLSEEGHRGTCLVLHPYTFEA
jgi:hypothetical protein